VENLLKEYNFGRKEKFIKIPISLGSPDNWNYAVSLAKVEYIKMLHSDDYFASGQSLEKYVELLDNNPQADFGFSAAESLSLSTKHKRIHSCSAKHLKRLQDEPGFLFFGNIIGPPSSIIYRKSINLLFDTNLKWLVDTDFYIRILNNNPVVAYSPEPLITVINGAEGQVTQAVKDDKQIQIKEYIILYNKLVENHTKINKEKVSFFFKLLFNKHNIKSLAELNAIISIPAGQEVFYNNIISAVNNGMYLTKIAVKFYNSDLNKNILKMELF